MKRKLALLLSACLLAAALAGCSKNPGNESARSGVYMPGVTADMNRAGYWIDKIKKPDDALLSAADITKVNQQIAAQSTSGVVDLVTFPSQIADTQLRQYLNEFTVPTATLYDANGTAHEASFMSNLQTSIGVDSLPASSKVSYAILLRNAHLRRLPTTTPAYTSADIKDEDVLQNGLVTIGSAALVLHNNTTQDWFYIQTRTKRGWVRADDLIFMEKGSWASYISTSKFLVVTAPNITLDANPASYATSGINLYMGTALPLYEESELPDVVDNQGAAGSYVVKVPSRDRYGYLEFKPMLIPRSADVSIGYLPYTQRNILNQAFKLLGRRYSAGSLYGGRDNAAFIEDIFSVFGIFLPSSTATQAAVPSSDVRMDGMSSDERAKAVAKLSPGALLFTPTQALLYLGEQDGKPYVLHTATEFYIEDQRYAANTTLVSGLDILNGMGATYIDSLTLVKTPAVAKADSAD